MMLFLRPFLGHISLGLAALCLILAGLWQMDKAGAQKWKARAETYRAQLDAISTAKNEQLRTTEGNVLKVESGDPEVRTIVKVIREASNPENCGTPGLTTLREVL